MKVLHITASYKPAVIYGGPIYSVAALCEALTKSEDRNPESDYSNSLVSNLEVITTLANGKDELPYVSGELQMVEGVPVTYFKRWSKDHSHFSPSLLWHLWKTAKNFDVVHIHSWWNLVSMGSVVICILKGIKPIVSPRGMLGDYTFSKGKVLFHQLLGKYLLSKCDFHATTMMEAEEIALRIGKGDIIDMMEGESPKSEARSRKVIVPMIFVVHNIVKLPKILVEKTRAFDGSLKLIFLSRIHPKKGIELLFDALSDINIPFTLSILGEGEANYIENLKIKVENLKLSNSIKWLGPVYDQQKFKILAENDLLVLPSYHENFANVVIESLAAGTPVLISENVGLKNYVEKNKLGIVFKINELKSQLIFIYNGFKTKALNFKRIDNSNSLTNDLINNYKKIYTSYE